MFKKKISVALSFVLIFVLAVCVTGCGKKTNGSNGKDGKSSDYVSYFDDEQCMDFTGSDRERVRVCLNNESGYKLSRTDSTFIIRDKDDTELVSGSFASADQIYGYKVYLKDSGISYKILEDTTKNKDEKKDAEQKASDKDSNAVENATNEKAEEFVPELLMWQEGSGDSALLNRVETISPSNCVIMYSNLDRKKFEKLLEVIHVAPVSSIK